MQTIIANVVSKVLRASVMPEPSTDVDVLTQQVTLMRRLISKGEHRRLGRTAGIRLLQVTFIGDRLVANVQGTTSTYLTRITMGKPGHHCTCDDWLRNGKAIGPCKHVLKLAEAWEDVLVGALERQ